MRLRSYLLLTITYAFNPDSLPTKTKIGLNNFLLDQYDLNIIHTEVKVSKLSRQSPFHYFLRTLTTSTGRVCRHCKNFWLQKDNSHHLTTSIAWLSEHCKTTCTTSIFILTVNHVAFSATILVNHFNCIFSGNRFTGRFQQSLESMLTQCKFPQISQNFETKIWTSKN